MVISTLVKIMALPCYLVPSSRVRLLVITMIIFIHAFRFLAEPHNSVSVQFVAALMSSSQRARGLPPFLVGLPPPIPNIIDFSILLSLRMICPKHDSCCFFINVHLNDIIHPVVAKIVIRSALLWSHKYMTVLWVQRRR